MENVPIGDWAEDPDQSRSMKSKPKRRGYTSGRTREWKKAIVQVREGETIPIFQGLEGTE